MSAKQKSSIRVLSGFMKGNFKNYVLSLLAAVAYSALNLLPPYITGGTVDSIAGREYSSNIMRQIFSLLGGREFVARNLYMAGAALILINISAGVFSFVKTAYSGKSSEKIPKKIRDEVFRHLQELPYGYHSRADKGDIIQRCTSDIETVRSFLSQQLIEMAGAALSIIFVFIAMATLNLRLTLISATLIPFIFIFSFIYFGRIKRAYTQVEEAEGRMSNTLQENVNGVRVVKAFGQELSESDKFDAANGMLYKQSIKYIRVIAGFWTVADTLSMLQIALLIISGVVLAVNGEVSVGMLATFITYEWLILWPVKQLGRTLGDLGRAMVSVGRIREILDEETEPACDDCHKPELAGDIVFKNLSFGYSAGNPVLKDISFRIIKGGTLGVMGPTGSGKSTLVHLLQRLFEYDSGSINIAGHELSEIDRKWLRRNIGIVLQEPFLYSKTIRDNIALSYMDADIQTVQAAASAAALHDVVTGFDQGYETMVGEKGVTLSGGQKQRVAIARTIIREKPILIFDDSLSAVDAETDAEIRKELKKTAGSSTRIIISHRINSLKDADSIIVIENGEISQSGTHDELLKQEGLYKRVYDVQNLLEEDIGKEVS